MEKFCKDCKHHSERTVASADECLRGSRANESLYLVRGVIPAAYCHIERMAGRPCGPDAAWFEPKVPA